MRDLRERLAQLTAWAAAGPPAVFWLAGFCHPSAFLSAVLQVRPAKLGQRCLPACALHGHQTCAVQSPDLFAHPIQGFLHLSGFWVWKVCSHPPAVRGLTAPPGTQAAARQAGVPADSLAFECDVLSGEAPSEPAPSGVYIKVIAGSRMLQAL